MASSISPGILARRNQARTAKRKDTLITSARENDISGLHWFPIDMMTTYPAAG
ncbi:hypothetical protein ACBQ16_13815 [Halopseudomonas bauzanensis]|uniref:hypothetical protein n=1 Tax=Halopseudomonas bauzanensis TaxID=653930 RepID=UPI003523C537